MTRMTIAKTKIVFNRFMADLPFKQPFMIFNIYVSDVQSEENENYTNGLCHRQAVGIETILSGRARSVQPSLSFNFVA